MPQCQNRSGLVEWVSATQMRLPVERLPVTSSCGDALNLSCVPSLAPKWVFLMAEVSGSANAGVCFVWCQRCTIVPSFQLGSFPAWLSARAFQPLFWCLMRIIHHSSLVSLNPPLNPFTPAPSRPLGLPSSCASCHHLQIQRGGTVADAGFFFLSVFSGP